METPFVFGKIATGKNFTDRANEAVTLMQNFSSLTNTVIISPRRWGKRSLAYNAGSLAMEQDSTLRVCHVDLLNVRSDDQFYSLLAQEVISATSSSIDDAVASAREFFAQLMPKVSPVNDADHKISITFDRDEVRRNPNAVIDIAETIARKNDLLIVVCVFEFQNIAEFTDTDKFQQLLHQRWQEHDNVAYCLCGSKPHVMKEIFAQHKPFHDFGDIIYLNKIGLPNLVEFFDRRFSETGKTITTEASRLIAELVDNHPYYAQQLAQLAWLRTMLRCDTAIVREAHAALVEQLSLLFVTITESLTTQQLCYLKALLSGEKAISTAEVMHRYQISSATSVARSKIALVKNEILDNSTGHPSFLDPLYAYWLKTQFFKIS